MRLLFLSALASASLLAANSAKADTFQNFSISADLNPVYYNNNGVLGSLSGTLTLDETTGVFTSASITATDSMKGVVSNITGAASGYELQNRNGQPVGTDSVIFVGTNSYNLGLYLENANSLVGYQGGNLCPAGNGVCEVGASPVISYLSHGDISDTDYIVRAGSLTPAVPEPSTLTLLGTGTLGAFSLLRRRVSR